MNHKNAKKISRFLDKQSGGPLPTFRVSYFVVVAWFAGDLRSVATLDYHRELLSRQVMGTWTFDGDVDHDFSAWSVEKW
jgi:hypothetical protein